MTTYTINLPSLADIKQRISGYRIDTAVSAENAVLRKHLNRANTMMETIRDNSADPKTIRYVKRYWRF
jgi:hypothetical protein